MHLRIIERAHGQKGLDTLKEKEWQELCICIYTAHMGWSDSGYMAFMLPVYGTPLNLHMKPLASEVRYVIHFGLIESSLVHMSSFVLVQWSS